MKPMEDQAEKKMTKEEEMRLQILEGARRTREQFDACGAPEFPCGFIREESFLPMEDGVRLHMLIYRPEGKSSFPVLVQRGCYPFQTPIYEVYGEELAQRGYGYIMQTCRGVGKSEGDWTPNVNERDDGLTLLKWLNGQDWAESIGYFGASYLALTGWAVADAVPEKVKGMFLTVYGTDRFKSAYEKGLFRHDVLTGWSMANAGHPVTADYLESCRFRPHDRVDEAMWGGTLPWYQDYIHSTRREDPYWQSGWWKQLEEIPAHTRVPVYIVESWYDHHFGSAMNTYAKLCPETKAHSWMDIGCWNHMSMECVAWGEQRHLENGDVARLLEWFDLLLKNRKTPEKRIRAYVMREDRWESFPEWPVPCSQREKVYLRADGSLTEDAPKEEEKGKAVSFDYDPEDPCPSHGAESVLTTIAEAGSLLQPAPGYRPDVVSWISEPLTQALCLEGGAKVWLKVRTDVEDTAFSAKLCEVFPDGKAYNIRSGITTIAADLAGKARYTPGDSVQVCIDFWDIVWHMQPGSRIRLDISSADFPQYAAHSNYPGIWSEQAQTRVAHQSILMDPDTFLELPLRL